ncbi:HFL121Wp [Eremothecium sinecaudum]|uniref:HFL121Wp n=1 Tax=Eremothecium sinecaudum TaxID=45286 RepID=A0A120K2J8_9SACH|nr:HFL121Wp [Eremothecium sinecaudum]AMD21735.1 HFL121Wp [Eremothecium sinecaudum]
MTSALIGRIVRKLYKYTAKLDNLIGPGKYLDNSVDKVLILGGTSNIFGVEVIKILLFEEGINVVNLDTVDHRELVYEENEENASVGHVESETVRPKAAKEGEYHFIKCESTCDKNHVLDGLNKVLEGDYGISVFINNVNEGLFEFMQGGTDPPLSHAPLDLKRNSFILGNQGQFQDLLNSNLINVMISVKFFLNEIVPQTMRQHGDRDQPPGFYIINTTNTISLHAPAFAGYFAASKAGLNQFHESLTSELGFYNNDCRIKTLLAFLPFYSTHTVSNVPWAEYAGVFIRALKLGRSGEMTLNFVPGRFSVAKFTAMSHRTRYWRAYEPYWWEKLLVAVSHGYPHVTNYLKPPRNVTSIASPSSRHVN